MELWIRSQSKLSLIKVNNICIRENSNIIVSYNDNFKLEDYIILGTYKAKERALEVLDKIQDHISDINDKEYGNEYYPIFIMPEE